MEQEQNLVIPNWGNFYSELAGVFLELCGYCEEECRGEVDHFRPKSRFPEHVYQWSNWILACHSCNHRKRDSWPPGEYVDSCAKTIAARPEKFFDFDTTTGLIKPKIGLSQAKRKKAMADDPGLASECFVSLEAQTPLAA